LSVIGRAVTLHDVQYLLLYIFENLCSFNVFGILFSRPSLLWTVANELSKTKGYLYFNKCPCSVVLFKCIIIQMWSVLICFFNNWSFENTL